MSITFFLGLIIAKGLTLIYKVIFINKGNI